MGAAERAAWKAPGVIWVEKKYDGERSSPIKRTTGSDSCLVDLLKLDRLVIAGNVVKHQTEKPFCGDVT